MIAFVYFYIPYTVYPLNTISRKVSIHVSMYIYFVALYTSTSIYTYLLPTLHYGALDNYSSKFINTQIYLNLRILAMNASTRNRSRGVPNQKNKQKQKHKNFEMLTKLESIRPSGSVYPNRNHPPAFPKPRNPNYFSIFLD